MWQRSSPEPGERVGGRKAFSGVPAEVGAAPHPRRPTHFPTLMSRLFPNYLHYLHEGSPSQFPKCLPEGGSFNSHNSGVGCAALAPGPGVTEAG